MTHSVAGSVVASREDSKLKNTDKKARLSPTNKNRMNKVPHLAHMSSIKTVSDKD